MFSILEEAKKIVHINSVTENGTEEIINCIKPIMEKIGFKINVQPVPHAFEKISKRQYNIIGILGDDLVDVTTRRGLMFLSHLDTGNPGITDHWGNNNGDPFKLVHSDNKLFGLGVADSKLDFLCRLKAAESFADRKFKIPLYLVGTCGSKLGFLGAKYLGQSLAVNPRFTMVSAPTGLKVANQTKSLLSLDIAFDFRGVEKDVKGYNTRIGIYCYGKSADSSTPEIGVNGIESAFLLLKKLNERKVLYKVHNITGGYSSGVIPDYAMIDIYIHSTKMNDFVSFFKEMLETSEHKYFAEFGGVGEQGLKFVPENVFQEIFKFHDLAKEKISSKKSNTAFSPSRSTACIRKISLESNRILIGYDCHFIPEDDANSYENEVKLLLQELNAANIDITVVINNKEIVNSSYLPVTSLLNTRLEEISESLDIKDVFTTKSRVTESSVFTDKNFDVVNFGVADINMNTGTPNENVSIEQIQLAVKYYQKIIEQFCLGE